MITKEELLKDPNTGERRDFLYPDEYTQETSDNLDNLLIAINEVRRSYRHPMMVNSGWRPAAVNDATSNAAKRSNHMKGLAVDIRDLDGALREWILVNLSLMQSLGLYIEDFRWTKGWVHFQIVAPSSGLRIYHPYADIVKNPMTAPSVWNGQYDHLYDKAT